MVPIVSQPAGQVESAAAPRQATFLYQQLLAYHRGELADPQQSVAVEERIRSDRRWQAHWESIRYIDLDRAAALQDSADLQRFSSDHVTGYCRFAAQSSGQVFDALMQGADSANGHSRKEWSKHVDGCVFCRRMRRKVLAQHQHCEQGLPVGEPLLRDWLLAPIYSQALIEAGRRLGFELLLEVPAPKEHAGGDTVIGLDTLLDNPPPPNPENRK